MDDIVFAGGHGFNAHAHLLTPLGVSAEGCRSDKVPAVTTLVTVIQSPHARLDLLGRIDVMTAIQGGNIAWLPVTTIEVL